MPPKSSPAKIRNELEKRLAQSIFPGAHSHVVHLQTLFRHYYDGNISRDFYASASALLQNFGFLSEIISGEYSVDHLSSAWVERHIGLFMEEAGESGLSIVGALNGLAIISAKRGCAEVLEYLRKMPQWPELDQEEMLISALRRGHITVAQWVLDQGGILFGDENEKELANIFRQVIGGRPTRDRVTEISEEYEGRGRFNRKTNVLSRVAISKDFVAFLALTHDMSRDSFMKNSEYNDFLTATSYFYDSLKFNQSDFGKYLIMYSLQEDGIDEVSRLTKIINIQPSKPLTKNEFVVFARIVPWFSASLSPYTAKCLEILSVTNPAIDHHDILQAFFLQSQEHTEDVFRSVDNMKQWLGSFRKMIDLIYYLWPNIKKTIDRNSIAEMVRTSLQKQSKKGKNEESAVLHFESYLDEFQKGKVPPPRSKPRL